MLDFIYSASPLLHKSPVVWVAIHHGIHIIENQSSAGIHGFGALMTVVMLVVGLEDKGAK